MVFVLWSRALPNMVMTTKTEGNLYKNERYQKLNPGYEYEF